MSAGELQMGLIKLSALLLFVACIFWFLSDIVEGLQKQLAEYRNEVVESWIPQILKSTGTVLTRWIPFVVFMIFSLKVRGSNGDIYENIDLDFSSRNHVFLAISMFSSVAMVTIIQICFMLDAWRSAGIEGVESVCSFKNRPLTFFLSTFAVIAFITFLFSKNIYFA